MNPQTKTFVLLLVLIGIIGSIWYLESMKPKALPVQELTTSGSMSEQQDTSSVESMSTATPSVTKKALQDRSKIIAEKAKQYPRGVELAGIKGYINTPEFKLADLVGKKVILVDFWTYSCINCQRTIPYLNAWYEKYKDQGLVIVGVHSPEFEFEKNYTNVANGTKDLGIKYPVVLDSDMSTWRAYQNQYWPHEYLIDIDGFIVHDHIGEGSYDESEKAIQKALEERKTALGLSSSIDTSIANPKDMITMDGHQIGSPETYFGSARNEFLANGKKGIAGIQTLTIPDVIQSNQLYLGGSWNFQDEYTESTSPTAKVTYKYSSKNVYFVASSKDGVKIKIIRDGKILTGAEAGKDVSADGTVLIKENRLYTLVNGSDYGEHTLEIEVEGAGLNSYTFTFG